MRGPVATGAPSLPEIGWYAGCSDDGSIMRTPPDSTHWPELKDEAGNTPGERPRLLFVQAATRTRAGLAGEFGQLGLSATIVGDVSGALRLLVGQGFNACLIDLSEGRSALTAARLVRARHPALPLVGLVDVASSGLAAEAMHAGVHELIGWPLDPLDVVALMVDARDRSPAGIRAAATDGLVAFSPAMRELLRRVREVARRREATCVAGGDSAARALVARAIHAASPDPVAPLVTVDCGSQPAAALECELFGGPGAVVADDTAGSVSADSAWGRATAGTLVVRHLDEAPARVQLRLAALMLAGKVAVGAGARPADLDVRVVATLAAGSRPAMLRPTLAALLVRRIDIPPLGQRREDVPVLAARCLDRRANAGAGATRFSRAALGLLSALPWPGDLPELEELVATVAREVRRPVVQIEDVLRHVRLAGAVRVAAGTGLRAARERFERECIEAALARHQGRVGLAARDLGIQRTNLYRKVRQLGISRELLAGHR